MILDRSAAVGASVEPGGEPLLRIGDPSALWLMVEVFVDDLPLVQEGAGASIQIATIPRPLRGRVECMDSTTDYPVGYTILGVTFFSLTQWPRQWSQQQEHAGRAAERPCHLRFEGQL